MSEIDIVSTDVLIIGGGPSGLAASIHRRYFKTKRTKRTDLTGGKRPVNRQPHTLRCCD